MADTKEELLNLTTTLALTDYLRAVVTPGAVPESKDITFANLQAAILSLVNLTDLMVPTLQVRTTADFDKTSDTTLAAVPGLSVNLVAGKNYRFTIRLHCVSVTSGGVKVTCGGTVTAGVFIADANLFYGSSGQVQARATSVTGGLISTAGANPNPYVEITGFISVSVGGTFLVQFAQGTSIATKSTVKVGSSMFLDEVA
jgi:hypothetical protein